MDSMRIDAGTSYPQTSRGPQATAADRSADVSFSAALTATQADSTKQVDFTSMSRSDMRNWVNTQIRSGEMSLDDGRPFMAMTMKIPVSGGLGGEVAAETDGTRYDFTQQVRDGIEGALSRNDQTTLRMLESAKSIMLRQQDQTIGVNIRV
jgi:hypothetical protein